MIRNAIEFGSGGGTNLQAMALMLLLAGILWLLFSPRKYALLGLLVPVFFIHMSQRVDVAGVNFFPLRILVIVGVLRILAELMTSGKTGIKLGPIDRALFWYSLAGLVTFSLLWLSVPALINRLGVFYDFVGGFFIVRFLVQDSEDVDRALKTLAAICAVFAAFMLVEQATGRNLLQVFGAELAWIRDEKFRARASFGHSILAGVFGATLFPLFVGMVRRSGGLRFYGFVGVLASTAMVSTSASSTPVMAFLAGILALGMWQFRHLTREIKWLAIFTLIGLHIVMKAPVWALIFKVSNVLGGTGYHRYQLVDQTINRFFEWWLVGSKTYGLWGYDMWDAANTYVSSGLTGGLITLVLFLVLLRRAFVALGTLRKQAAGNRVLEWEAWTFTSALFAHAVAFFGVTYFDQTILLWLLFLGMIVALTTSDHTMQAPAPRPAFLPFHAAERATAEDAVAAPRALGRSSWSGAR